MRSFLIIVVLLALTGLIILSAVAGVSGGGSLSDPDFYCRVPVIGNLLGQNLELGELECDDLPYPTSFYDARLLGGDTNVKCQAQVDDFPFAEEELIGNIGFTEKSWYNFKINNIPVGEHQITIRCMGDEYSVEKTYLQRVT